MSAHPQTTQGYENGIEIDQLEGLVEMIRRDPQVGEVTARTRHRWQGGYAIEGEAVDLTEAGETISRTHRFRADWPQPFGGDRGPTTFETVLATVGNCVAATFALKAALDGIAIDELEVTTEGRLNMQGLFGLDSANARFSSIAVTVRVQSDADEASLEALGRTVTQTSPAYDALANPVPIELNVEPRA